MSTRLKPTKALPENAKLAYAFSVYKNRAAFWVMNAVMVPLLFLFGGFFVWYLFSIRPDLIRKIPFMPSNDALIGLVLIGTAILTLVLHELIHALAFWIFTRQVATFGFRGWYAFAAAPGWFFPRWQYLLIALAPLLLISILGLVLLAILPAGVALVGVLFAVIINAAGSVGDLWFSIKVIGERRPMLVEDLGEGMKIYALS